MAQRLNTLTDAMVNYNTYSFTVMNVSRSWPSKGFRCWLAFELEEALSPASLLGDSAKTDVTQRVVAVISYS